MNLQFFSSNNIDPIFTFYFPSQYLGQVSPAEKVIHLWNRKGGSSNYVASDVKISIEAGITNYEGKEVFDEELVEAKSNGVVGSGIIDDAQASWTPLGELIVGDIPVNTARKIHLRLKSQLTTVTQQTVFTLKVRYGYERQQTYAIQIIVTNGFFPNYFLGGKLV